MLFFSEILPQGTWEKVDSPVSENLSSVFFVDSSYGWAAGFSGIIIHTSNGGKDWTIQDSKTTNNIADIFFLNRNIGWAFFWEVSSFPFGTYVLKTNDGGVNWIASPSPAESCFGQTIFFQDSLNGWMGGKPYPIVQTSDGGITWEEALIDSSTYSTFPVYDLKFYNSNIGYASGGVFDCCGIIWLTTNGGSNWFAIDTPFVAPEPIYSLHLTDSINVLGVGGDFELTGFGVGIINSSDAGETWNFEYIGTSGVAWDIAFRSRSDAWAPLGGEANLIYSMDSGINWSSVPTPDSALIFRITFPDSLHGFGIGNDGVIIKYKPDSTTSNFTRPADDQHEFNLEQNYPNPFNSKTKINFWISEFGFVLFKVYDILGNEVATLVNEYKSAGKYEIEFDANDLAGGVYLYTMFIENYSASRKMILLP